MDILRMVLTGIYVLAALAIIVVVLLQEGKSAGLGSAFATNQESYWNKNKKHTLEGKFETWTKVTAGIFVVLAIALTLI
ncbi:preprotein translocase subunit SecG [Niameybacter massiliensis]|uniref:Protein-export membrane protein SecG n=1 Tax=Holtiella tumoricola TaxID=3018743 RepID=A0AA42J1Y9_9FIRM|nr:MULTISPECIES: preprotein translocase subunit SecG [Lachnospirales]MDA3732890.1 preprotein translocase subunit SecG [Holtiella tumoricola]